MLKKNNLNFTKDILILFCFISFIYLFSLKIYFIEVRFFVLFLLIPCIYFFIEDIKNRDFTLIKYSAYIFLFFLIHLLIGNNFEIEKINNYQLKSIILLFGIFIISYYFNFFFNSNIFKLIILFIIIFFISSLSNFISFQHDSPYFCGGIPDFFNIMKFNDINHDRPLTDIRLSFKEIIFQENSHLGMIAPSIIIFSSFLIFAKKKSYIEKILILFFILLCFVKSSTTFILGLFLSLIILVSYEYNKLSKNILFFFSLLILICFFTLIFNKECNKRFVSLDNKTTLSSKINFDNNIKIKKKIINLNNFSNFFKNITEENTFLTKAVHFHALSIMKKSLVEKPLGWGLNNYNMAFDYFNKKYKPNQKFLINYNTKDGTNNFVKIFVEFGVFGFVFYIFIFLFFINRSISLELKLFYLPIIITQSLRGAGYFNGGFILIAFLMLFTYINSYKKLK